MTSMPNTTFSQNNGVIALTRCASRRAGIACACWLIFFGILAKVCARRCERLSLQSLPAGVVFFTLKQTALCCSFPARLKALFCVV